MRLPLKLEHGRVTNALILEHAICKPTERQTTADQMRVGRALKRFGWTKRHTKRGNVWSPPGKEVFTASEPQNGAQGVHGDEVFTTGIHPESRGNSRDPEGVNTVNTDSRTHSSPKGGHEPDFRVHGIHLGPDGEPAPDDLVFYE